MHYIRIIHGIIHEIFYYQIPGFTKECLRRYRLTAGASYKSGEYKNLNNCWNLVNISSWNFKPIFFYSLWYGKDYNLNKRGLRILFPFLFLLECWIEDFGSFWSIMEYWIQKQFPSFCCIHPNSWVVSWSLRQLIQWCMGPLVGVLVCVSFIRGPEMKRHQQKVF